MSLDMNGVLSAVFDGVNKLNTQKLSVTTTATSTPEDENGAWSNAYDETTHTLRIIVVA